MNAILENLPKNLPPGAWIVVVIIITAGIIIYAKLTGNSNKQNIGSNNQISGNINQQIGDNNNRDKS